MGRVFVEEGEGSNGRTFGGRKKTRAMENNTLARLTNTRRETRNESEMEKFHRNC